MIHTKMYVSTLSDETSDDDLATLLSASRERNRQADITGLLVVRGRRVMQMLEGEHDAVQHLFARIKTDPRHQDVVTVWDSRTLNRRFPDWSMAFDDLDDPGPSRTTASTQRDDAPVAVTPSPDDCAFAHRREVALRRAMVNGNQLIASLAVILQGHRPEQSLEPDGTPRMRCAECLGGLLLSDYPCNTARQALWAIESTQPRS